MKKTPFFILSFLAFFVPQLNAQFFLNQDAVQVSDSCFRLTESNFNQVGSIWFAEKINLNESFEVLMDLYFGCSDSGADGIVFGFQPVSTSVGSNGGGIGFAGVSPSFAVEFDTYQNPQFGDPSNDHIVIIKDGVLDHNFTDGSLAGPVSANINGENIEDCEFHEMRMTWDVAAKTATVYFDCEERVTYTGDIVNEIFDGNPEVFWGFTAATGGASNVQEVCFSYTTFLDKIEDVVICPGGEYQLAVNGQPNYDYLWSPPDGLSNPNIANPLAFPAETTTYIVEITDGCNVPFADTVNVFVDGDTVRFELANDTILCDPATLILDAENGSPATYLWSDGLTDAVREVDYAGNFAVTVTLDDYCLTRANVNVGYADNPSAILPEDTILCIGKTLDLDVSTGGNSEYLWSDGSTSPTLNVSESGEYSVSVTNFCGENSTDIRVSIEGCTSIYIPNAFSPNFDGANDFFALFSDGDVSEVLIFQIYDRWGTLLHEQKGIVGDIENFRWDGNFRDKPAPQGVYVYTVEVRFRDESTNRFSGDFTLIR